MRVGRPFRTTLFRIIAAFAAFGLATVPVVAGMPRGVTIAADEQLADETTGVTIARGNAVLMIDHLAIKGTATAIEVRPKINEVLLRGSAEIRVGRNVYRADLVSCTLDFERCAVVDETQPLPASALGAEAATSPR